VFSPREPRSCSLFGYTLFGQLRRTLLVGGRRGLIGGGASQPYCPQPHSLSSHGMQFCVIVGYCLLALPQLLFLLEQRFRATMRLVRIHENSVEDLF
jgi:hypothetical protein